MEGRVQLHHEVAEGCGRDRRHRGVGAVGEGDDPQPGRRVPPHVGAEARVPTGVVDAPAPRPEVLEEPEPVAGDVRWPSAVPALVARPPRAGSPASRAASSVQRRSPVLRTMRLDVVHRLEQPTQVARSLTVLSSPPIGEKAPEAASGSCDPSGGAPHVAARHGPPPQIVGGEAGRRHAQRFQHPGLDDLCDRPGQSPPRSPARAARSRGWSTQNASRGARAGSALAHQLSELRDREVLLPVTPWVVGEESPTHREQVAHGDLPALTVHRPPAQGRCRPPGRRVPAGPRHAGRAAPAL